MDTVGHDIIADWPREGYGYGLIRMTWQLTHYLVPLLERGETNTHGELTQRYMQENKIFEHVKYLLHLPDDCMIHGIFMEPPRLTWCIVVEVAGIPQVDEGEMLPVLLPIYVQNFDPADGTHVERFVRFEISDDYQRAMRVD